MPSSAEAEGGVSSGASGELVYRMTRLRRGLGAAGAVGLLGLVGFEIAGSNTLWTRGVLTDLAMASFVAVAAARQLGTRVRLTGEAITVERLLGSDRTVRFENVERFQIPMVSIDSGARLYVNEGASPALTLSAGTFEDFDDLLWQVARRLPNEAEISDPAGRVQEE